jgi:hypothetical protein
MDSLIFKLCFFYVVVFMICFPIVGTYLIVADPGCKTINGTCKIDNDGNEIPEDSTVGWGIALLIVGVLSWGGAAWWKISDIKAEAAKAVAKAKSGY